MFIEQSFYKLDHICFYPDYVYIPQMIKIQGSFC